MEEHLPEVHKQAYGMSQHNACCQQVMKQLIFLLPTCTDREALNLAVFFHETFTLVERWRVRPSIYKCSFSGPREPCNLPPVLCWPGSSAIFPLSCADLGPLQQLLIMCVALRY